MSVYNDPACYVLIERDGKLLFVLREHTGYMDGFYSLPAGHVEADESYSAGAIREAREEVGVEISHANVEQTYTMHRKVILNSKAPYWTDVFFTVKQWSGEPVNIETDKHSRIEWLDWDNLPENIMDYQRFALLQIKAGQQYGEFGWD